MNLPESSPVPFKTAMTGDRTDSDRTKAETLDARVRSLKIAKSDRADQSRNKVSWLPWSLVVGLGLFCVWLIIKDSSDASKLGAETASTKLDTGSNSRNSATTSNSSLTKSSLDSKGELPAESTGNSSGITSRTVSANPNSIALEARGYIIAKHQVLVSPQVSGRILSLNIEEGRRVKKGEVLAEVEQTEYRVEVDQLKATLQRTQAELEELKTGARPQELAGAAAELKEQEVVATQLESQFKRLQDALKNNAISLAEFEEAQSNFFSNRSRIEKLRQSLDMMKEGPRKERIAMASAAVAQAEANLAKAQWRLDNCTLRAPISGTILKKNAEEGNLVNPIAFNGSFSVCDIADLSDLEVDLNIQERDVAKVFAGQACEVRSEAYPKRAYKATVSRLMPIADRAKGAVPVRVAVKVPEGEEGVFLKPEMSAIVVFYGEPTQ